MRYGIDYAKILCECRRGVVSGTKPYYSVIHSIRSMGGREIARIPLITPKGKIMYTSPSSIAKLAPDYLACTHMAAIRSGRRIADRVDNLLVRYDGWFLVAMVVLLAIAATVATALAVWCLTVKGGSFTGRWEWGQWYVSVWAECRV